MIMDGLFQILINDILYFEEEIAILEFFMNIDRWIENSKNTITDFNYSSIEYEEKDPLISVLIQENDAYLEVLWKEQALDNKFNLEYLFQEFISLRNRLKIDLENYYNIDVNFYKDKLPLINY